MDNTPKIHENSKINADIQTHLSDYLAIISKHKWLVLGCFFLIVGSVTFFSLLSNPVYQATAQVMIRAQPSPVNPLGEDTARGYYENEYFQTQVNLISNRTLAWKVITALNLKEKIQQNINGNENAIASEVKQSSQRADKSENKAASEQDPQLINWYLNHLEVVPLPDSNLVNVNFNGDNPKLVANIANTHTRLAIDQSIQLQKLHAHNALEWLKDQIKAQRKEVEEAQKRIHGYQKKNDLVSVEDRQDLITQELDQINSDLVEARNQRIAKQAAFDQLQKVAEGQVGPLILPENVDDTVLQNLRNRMVELNARKVEMSTNYGPKHPKMIQLNQGIDQLKKEMDIEIDRLKKTIKADLNRAISIESGLKKTLNQKKNLAMALGEKNIEYDVLKRQADSSDEIYDFLLKQSKEINLSSVMDTSGVQVVDNAEIPDSPIKPNHKLNIVMAMIIGLLFSTSLAFFIEYMDNTVKDTKDIAVWLDLPVLAMVPFDKRLKDGETSVLSWKPEESLPKKKYPYPSSYYPINRFPMLLNDHGNSPNGRVIVIESHDGGRENHHRHQGCVQYGDGRNARSLGRWRSSSPQIEQNR
jgi:succinoglycan biosynthesis transport protein ExoP